MAKNDPIQMRLRSVSEIKFSMSSGKLGSDDRGDELKVGFRNQLFPNTEEDSLMIHFGVQYSIDGEVVLESVYSFDFDVKNLSDYVIKNADGKITVKEILPHIISVAVGTMRGILVVRTAGTDIEKYPIPMMDPVKLCEHLAK